MADETPPTPIPDPQLEAILDVLQHLLVSSTQDVGVDYTAKLDAIWEIIDDVHNAVVDVLNAVEGISSVGGAGSDPQLNAILEELRKLYDVQTAVTATEIKEPEEASGGGAGIAEVLGGILGAVTAVVGALLAAVAATQSFVSALQPGLVEQFGRTLRDLQATIGVAFTGIFEQGANFVKGIAAAVQPVFAALKPVVDQLVSSVLKTLVSSMTGMTGILLAFVPLLKIVVDLFSMLTAVLRPVLTVGMLMLQAIIAPLAVLFSIVEAVLEPVVKLLDAFSDGLSDVTSLVSTMLEVVQSMLTEFVTALFGVSVKDVVKQVTDAFRELLKAVVIAAVKLSQLTGSNEFAIKLRNALSRTGEAAAGSTSLKSLEQIGKDMATASVNAAGTASVRDATNADIVKTLDGLIEANKSGSANIVDAILRRARGESSPGSPGGVRLPPVSYALSPLSAVIDVLNPY